MSSTPFLTDSVEDHLRKMGAGQNRPGTESPRHNRPNKVGDYVLFISNLVICFSWYPREIMNEIN